MRLHDFYCVSQLKEKEYLLLFGKNLRKLRKSKGLTQAELANDLGIEISQISRIERGIINTSVYTIYRISRILDIDVSTLHDFDEKS